MPDPRNPWGERPEPRRARLRAVVGPRRGAALWTVAIVALLVAKVVAGIVVDLRQPTGFSYLRDLYLAPSLSATVRREASGPAIVALTGEIGAAAGPWFYALVRDHDLKPGDLILLSSPGGNLDAAFALGRTIRAHRFDTAVGRLGEGGAIVPSFCASACVFAFAGGVERRDVAGSRLGVHRFRLVGSGMEDAATAKRETLDRIRTYLSDMGIKPSLAEVAMQTDAIRWLSPQAARAMDLVSSGGR